MNRTESSFLNFSTWARPVWETPFSAHLRRSRPDGRRCRGPKGRGSRCEAARAAIRFGGQVREDVLKCTIAPGFGRKGDPSSPSFSPCLSSPPLLLPFLPFQPAARGPRGGVEFAGIMAHNRLPLYSAFDDDQPLPIYPVSGARQGTVRLSAIRVLHYIVERKLLMVLPRARDKRAIPPLVLEQRSDSPLFPLHKRPEMQLLCRRCRL